MVQNVPAGVYSPWESFKLSFAMLDDSEVFAFANARKQTLVFPAIGSQLTNLR